MIANKHERWYMFALASMNGPVIGAIYSAALGVSLVVGIMNVCLNFAHGELYILLGTSATSLPVHWA